MYNSDLHKAGGIVLLKLLINDVDILYGNNEIDDLHEVNIIKKTKISDNNNNNNNTYIYQFMNENKNNQYIQKNWTNSIPNFVMESEYK
jgi:hypothetical protein